MKKWVRDLYFTFLDIIGRPDFPLTWQLRNVARERPWLFILVGLPLFVYWLACLLRSDRKWAWVVFGISAFVFTTWLMLHVGGFW